MPQQNPFFAALICGRNSHPLEPTTSETLSASPAKRSQEPKNPPIPEKLRKAH
jgi:hypothetical protein